MLWNRIENEKVSPYENPAWHVGDGLEEYDEIIEGLRQNDLNFIRESINIRQARGLEYHLTKCKLLINPVNWFGIAVAGWVTGRKRERVIKVALRPTWYHTACDGNPNEELKLRLMREGQIAGGIDCDHSTPSWSNLLKFGFSGLRERVSEFHRNKRTIGNLSEAQENFYVGAEIAYDAVLNFLDRLILCTANREREDERFAVMHEALKKLRYNPPETLYEALLFSYLFHWICENGESIQVRTLGHVDDIFRPYYEHDLASGRLTRAQAKELLQSYILAFAFQNNPHGQPATLGGTLLNGESAVNDLSYLFLEAYDACAVKSPKLHILVSKNTPDSFLKTCLDMSRRGHNSMVFLNEELYRKIIEKHYDAQDLKRVRLGSSGCYNLCMDDLINVAFHMRINLPIIIQQAFTDESLPGISSFEEFSSLCNQKFLNLLNHCIVISDWHDSIANYVNPANLYSGSVQTALETGCDMFTTGAKFNDTAIIVSCPATLFDSLIMVKKYVFDQKLLTLVQFKEILEQNWKGAETLRNRILADSDKWGNNIDWVDKICVDFYRGLKDAVNSHRNKRGGKFLLCGDTIDFDIWFKDYVRATPDGRMEGEPLAKSLIANRGQDRRGITQLIHSVTKLPAVDMPFGAPFDYMLHPSAVRGDEGLSAMLALLRTFLELDGYSFMGNVVDAECLKDAKVHPEKYRTLQVRLCGWSVYFNDLQEVQKDMLIKQAECLV